MLFTIGKYNSGVFTAFTMCDPHLVSVGAQNTCAQGPGSCHSRPVPRSCRASVSMDLPVRDTSHPGLVHVWPSCLLLFAERAVFRVHLCCGVSVRRSLQPSSTPLCGRSSLFPPTGNGCFLISTLR